MIYNIGAWYKEFFWQRTVLLVSKNNDYENESPTLLYLMGQISLYIYI